MNIENIETFYTVAQFKSFQKAADALVVTQSGISRRIQSLENELGVSLFNRNPQSVSLTKHGVAFYSYANRLLTVYNGCLAALKEVKKNTITIGMPYTLYGFLADVFARFIRESAVPLVIRCASSKDVYDELIDQTVDLGITSAIYPSAQVEYKEIYRERLVCVAAPALTESFSNSVVKSMPFIFVWMHNFKSSPWIEFYHTLNDHPQFDIKVELNYFEGARELALKGVGYTTLPYSEVKNQLESGELVEVHIPDLNLPFRSAYIATYKQTNSSEDLKALSRLLGEMSPVSFQ